MSKSVIIDNLVNDQLYGFRIFPRNLKGQYQTETDGATATATPVAFSLPTYTGQYTIFGNETEGRIEMYTSGTLNLSAGTYDVFVVGAGGNGDSAYGGGSSNGGGGGGYTKTIKKIKINNSDIDISIGSGGGNNTLIGNYILAFGGKTADYNGGKAGDGGSGGGFGDYGNGGSDGSDGVVESGYDNIKLGNGQHTTTRAFGETNGTLYAGGGGGGGEKGGYGGAGGGGAGASGKRDFENGTPNTGGGGGAGQRFETNTTWDGGKGGSGIAIIRWKNN